jgi:hypothetical protein
MPGYRGAVGFEGDGTDIGCTGGQYSIEKSPEGRDILQNDLEGSARFVVDDLAGLLIVIVRGDSEAYGPRGSASQVKGAQSILDPSDQGSIWGRGS